MTYKNLFRFEMPCGAYEIGFWKYPVAYEALVEEICLELKMGPCGAYLGRNLDLCGQIYKIRSHRGLVVEGKEYPCVLDFVCWEEGEAFELVLAPRGFPSLWYADAGAPRIRGWWWVGISM